MNLWGWLQIGVYCLVILALVRPLGLYLYRVFEGEQQPLPRLLGRVEHALLRLCGVERGEEQGWQEYTRAMLLFSGIGLLVAYLIQRSQHLLPFNPQHLGPVPSDLAFNTAASFTTNTN
ncbi:MAG TPA: potassium-transporting ATPase subunit KdpA, partial [bacterium]